MKPIRILPALVAIPIAVAGCGSSGTAPTARSATSSHAAAPAPAPAPATATATDASATAASQGGAPANAISKINGAFKRLSPQQLQAIKKRLPAYMHALEECAKATGGAQAATLACVRSHGFGPAAP
jgi:hypothetical protein